jgi:hypothetical protein
VSLRNIELAKNPVARFEDAKASALGLDAKEITALTGTLGAMVAALRIYSNGTLGVEFAAAIDKLVTAMPEGAAKGYLSRQLQLSKNTENNDEKLRAYGSLAGFIRGALESSAATYFADPAYSKIYASAAVDAAVLVNDAEFGKGTGYEKYGEALKAQGGALPENLREDIKKLDQMIERDAMDSAVDRQLSETINHLWSILKNSGAPRNPLVISQTLRLLGGYADRARRTEVADKGFKVAVPQLVGAIEGAG